MGNGELFEYQVAKIMKEKGFEVIEAPKRRFYDYDLIINKVPVELKHCTIDEEKSYTGNIFVETMENGEPTGLSLSKSEYYCFGTIVDGFEAIFIKTDTLKELCFPRFYREICKNSDYNNSGYAIPIDIIRHNSISMNDFILRLKIYDL